MSPKKEIAPILSEEERNQVQLQIATYHQLADTLHSSTSQQEVEEALASLTDGAEAVQLGVLKAMARENHTDAADIVLALYELAPAKEVRKEARRTLIRLETSGSRPQWTPPLDQNSAIQSKQPESPRFWKGWASRTREEGELQLFLAWEQGYDYTDARALVFLLDFWQEGVKDCLVMLDSKRHIDENSNSMRSKLNGVTCTPAEGRRLLDEALGVNAWRGTQPHATYRDYLALINTLLPPASELGEDSNDEHTLIDPELLEQEVAVNFLGAWSMGDYGLTYDMLSKNSPLRANVTRTAWIEQHRAWATEANPTRMELSFIREREASQGLILLPGRQQSSTRKEVEVGWSLEVLDTPLSGTLAEMPLGTAVNKDTGRHWFWTSMSLVREQNAWRIQRIADEGAISQGLSIPELQRRIKEQQEALEVLLQQNEERGGGRPDQQTIEEVGWRMSYLLHYRDALISRLPLDYQVVQEAYQNAAQTGNSERILVYLDRMIQRFPNNHLDNLLSLGATLVDLSFKFDAPPLQDRQKSIRARAEEVLRQATTEDQRSVSYTLLAELLQSQQRYDEAREALLKARDLAHNPNEEAVVEAGLGNLALSLDQPAEAIPHYKHAIELRPDQYITEYNLGLAQRRSGQAAEAEASLRHVIEIDPEMIGAYSELVALFSAQKRTQESLTLVRQGLQTNPRSARLHALLATVLLEGGDLREAERELQLAMSIDPNDDLVRATQDFIQKIKKR